MIRGEGASQFHKLSERPEQLPAAAIVPLGVPLMAGPGAISTVILASPEVLIGLKPLFSLAQ